MSSRFPKKANRQLSVCVGKIRNIGDICLKIDIIGSVASGKTRHAKRISKKYGVPYYEKDNIV